MALVFGRQPVRAVKANRFAVRALDVGCDPKPMLDLLKREGWWGDFKPVRGLIAGNGLEALLAAGLGEGALCWVRAIWEDGELRDPAGACSVRLWESRACAQTERWEEAVKAQNQAMDAFGRVTHKRLLEELRWPLCWNGYGLQIHQGMTEGLEEKCLALLESAPAPRLEVESHLLLGRLYLALDKPQKAEEHLTDVIKRGNGLYAVTQAELLLAEHRGEAPSGATLIREGERKLRQLRLPWSLECRFTPSLEVSLEALTYPGVEEDGETSLLFHGCAAAALINLGRYQEGLDQLDRIRLPSRLERQREVKLSVLVSRIAAHTALGHLEEAMALQDQAEALLQGGGEELETFRRALENNACGLAIKMGRLEGVEEKAKEGLEQADDELGRVCAHMRLGRYYLAVHREEEARPHLAYVAQHGGEHHFRAEAAELLGIR